MVDSPPAIEYRAGLSSDACAISAAARYGIGADLLLAVRSVERGMPSQRVGNTDGSYDHNEPGLNTRTLYEMSLRGWDSYRLRVDGCYAMYAASAWMAQKFRESGGRDLSLLSRAARYNSATPSHNEAYQRKLAPYIGSWGCYLYVFWKQPPERLFVVAAGLMNEQELEEKCQRL